MFFIVLYFRNFSYIFVTFIIFREASIEEQIAAVKVQRMWRGYFVRKLQSARQPGAILDLKIS